MQQSKLISLFRQFSDDELIRFDKFLASPYFNQSDKLLKFFRLIAQDKPLFNSPSLEKQKLHKTLHGTKKYSDTTMRELISDLFKQAKVFLAHEGLTNDGPEASAVRFKWLLNHNLIRLAETELENREELLHKLTDHNRGYYLHSRILDSDRFEVVSRKFEGSEYKLINTFDFYKHIHSLNRDYLVNNLHNYIYLLAMARIYKFKSDESLLLPLEQLLQPYLNQGDVVIDMFYNIMQLVRTGEEKYFFELKARFFATDKTVPMSVITEASTGLSNYTALKIRAGEQRYKDECIEIYKFEVEKGYHLVNGRIDHIAYQNIAMMAAETQNFDWADYFLETYKNNLPEEAREDSYKYSKAYLLFGQKKFEEALRFSLSQNSPSFLSKVSSRLLIAGSQYELCMFDELNRELDMLAYHLKDENMTKERKQSYVVFSEIMRLLGELKANYNRNKLQLLKSEIYDKKELLSREWFHKKIAELEEMHQ